MFWITFFVSGLTIASIPWVASHFNNQIAGYLVVVPIMMTISIIVQYNAHGPKNTIEMIAATLLALPTLAVFGLTTIILIKHDASLPVVILSSLLLWFVLVFLLNQILAK
jgi:ABC-type tungstate transport system substrate-binding protein